MFVHKTSEAETTNLKLVLCGSGLDEVDHFTELAGLLEITALKPCVKVQCVAGE